MYQLIDDHDCHAGPEDGCQTCVDELERLNCTMCEAYRREEVGETCPYHAIQAK